MAEKGELEQLHSDEDRIDFLKDLFKRTEKKLKSSGIDYSSSGTCAISVFIQAGKVYVANLGDSRAVMFRETAKEKLAIELSYDHKPVRPDERERIERMGGKVYKLIHEGQPVGPPRVWADEEGPGIAMTRTLGDLDSKKIGLISEPEVQSLELDKNDKFIVIGSDGVWDVMNSAQVCGFVNSHLDDPGKVADLLVQECKSHWE
jgi:integrin-linked kinase-associated serine/threonine phosphatase 2C